VLRIDDTVELERLVGTDLGVTGWLDVTQERVDAFADATNDHASIHIDVEQARAKGLAGTIAHGLYTLSLGPGLLGELLVIGEPVFGLNYGFDRVRFVKPVAVGDRIRMRARVEDVSRGDVGSRIFIAQTFESQSAAAVVCVARSIIHCQPARPSSLAAHAERQGG
jgi:acyl dehydratase